MSASLSRSVLVYTGDQPAAAAARPDIPRLAPVREQFQEMAATERACSCLPRPTGPGSSRPLHKHDAGHCWTGDSVAARFPDTSPRYQAPD